MSAPNRFRTSVHTYREIQTETMPTHYLCKSIFTLEVKWCAWLLKVKSSGENIWKTKKADIVQAYRVKLMTYSGSNLK